MSEFAKVETDKLPELKLMLESYLRGIKDTFSIFEDVHQKSVELYNHKIYLINTEIDNRKLLKDE